MSDAPTTKQQRLNLQELVQLFSEAIEVLPEPFNKFAAKLAMLTRHVWVIDQRLRALDKVLAQIAQAIVKLSEAQQPAQTPTAEPAATPPAPETQQAQPEQEDPAGKKTVDEMVEEVKKRIKARNVVEEDVVPQAAS